MPEREWASGRSRESVVEKVRVWMEKSERVIRVRGNVGSVVARVAKQQLSWLNYNAVL
jgi:hypothetical protein